MVFDERRVAMFKQRLDALERQNKLLRDELTKKDHAFSKCADLCAFFT